jgi:hypothetical protein
VLLAFVRYLKCDYQKAANFSMACECGCTSAAAFSFLSYLST